MSDHVGFHRIEGTEVTSVATLPPAKSAGKTKDLNEFIDLAAIALVDYQRKLGIATSEQLILREAFPKDPVEKPDVGIGLALSRVITRQFANTTNDGTRRTWRPRSREEVPHPTDTNLCLSVLAIEMDNVVEFKIVSQEVAKKIEEVLVHYDSGTVIRQETINAQHGVNKYSIDREGSNS